MVGIGWIVSGRCAWAKGGFGRWCGAGLPGVVLGRVLNAASRGAASNRDTGGARNGAGWVVGGRALGCGRWVFDAGARGARAGVGGGV